MLNDIRTAFAFLTIIPVGQIQTDEPGRSFAYYPLVGLVIGLLLAGAGFLMFHFLQSDLVVFLVLFLWVILTGGLHLDGFGDSCDGLLATVEPQRRLAIMKDPQTGSWAVIGLILLLLGKWVMLRTLPIYLWIAVPVVGRLTMVIAAYAFPYARESGLGAYFRQGLEQLQVIVAIGITIIVVIGIGRIFDPVTFWLLTVAPFTALIGGQWAAKRLGGGITGDVYGALCEVTELLCLLILNLALAVEITLMG